jgi:dTDP-4-dehydrorhamnose reductase
MRVAVIGANGQLGSELMALGNATEGFCMIGFTHDQCEVSTRGATGRDSQHRRNARPRRLRK